MQRLVHQISGQEHGACTVAEGEKIMGLTPGKLSGTVQISCKLGAHRIAAEHAQDEGISTVGGQTKGKTPEACQGRQKPLNNAGVNQQIGEDEKGQESGDERVHPQPKALA